MAVLDGDDGVVDVVQVMEGHLAAGAADRRDKFHHGDVGFDGFSVVGCGAVFLHAPPPKAGPPPRRGSGGRQGPLMIIFYQNLL